MTRFQRGDRVWHRQLGRFGTYQERHNWGEWPSPETSSYVWFDGDPQDEPVPVTTEMLVRESEAPR